MKRFFSVLLMMVSLLVWAVPVQAATVPTGFETWPQQTTTDTHKIWTVKFSAPMDLDSVNINNIYVTDDNNLPVKTTLTRSSDGSSVQVIPVNAYIVGRQYWLFMTGAITTNNGKQYLSKPGAMPFTVTADSKISSVSDKYSDLLTSFTVITSPDVCSVKINQTEMLYKGDNNFRIGMTGLKQGANVTVYAFDGKGILLQSQIYKVK